MDKYSSKSEILCWVNQILKINITKIETLGSGAIYCQILDCIYPKEVPLNKVNFQAKFEQDFTKNFMILQQCFSKLRINKTFPIQKLVKAKFQDNLEFIQWFKIFFHQKNVSAQDYDPIQRRQGQKIDFSFSEKICYQNVMETEEFQQNVFVEFSQQEMETFRLIDRILKSDENDKLNKIAILLGIPQDIESIRQSLSIHQKTPNKQLSQAPKKSTTCQKMTSEKVLRSIQRCMLDLSAQQQLSNIQYSNSSYMSQKDEQLIDNLQKTCLKILTSEQPSQQSFDLDLSVQQQPNTNQSCHKEHLFTSPFTNRFVNSQCASQIDEIQIIRSNQKFYLSQENIKHSDNYFHESNMDKVSDHHDFLSQIEEDY